MSWWRKENFPARRNRMFQGHESANMLMSKHEVRRKANRPVFLEDSVRVL